MKQDRRCTARALSRFSSLITRHPLHVLAVAAVVGAVAATMAARIELDGSYLALLPDGASEVGELRAVLDEAGGSGELVLAVGGTPVAERLPFARRLSRNLRDSGLVAWAQAELPVGFIDKRKLMLLPKAELVKLRRAVERGVAKARAKANPMFVDLDDDDAGNGKVKDAWADLRRLQASLPGAASLPKRVLRSKDGRYLFVLAKPRAAATELAAGQRVLDGINAVVARTLREHRAAGGATLRVRMAGSLVEQQRQHQAMKDDMSTATVVALIGVVLLITVFTRRATAIVVVGAPLMLGVAITLALTVVVVGHLNVVSGFLVAALVGLGIDFGVHLILRYLDELPVGAAPDANGRAAAMRRAIDATFSACATGAATTAAAFLALRIADFRGFSEYGLIAALGVVLTLVATFTVLPPLAQLLVRRGRTRARRMPRRLARGLAWTMVVVTVGFAAASAARVGGVRFHNDFRALQGKVPGLAFADYVSNELGGSLAPAIVMADNLASARRAEAILRKHVGAEGGIKRVVSLADVVPSAASARARGRELQRIQRALAHVKVGLLSRADARKLDELKTLAAVKPWTIADVPQALKRRFVSPHGKQFLLVWAAENLRDDAGLKAWTQKLDAALGDVRAAGLSVLVLDENRIAARVLDLVAVDGPRVLVAAALAVLAVLLVYFRRPEDVLLVAGSLGLAMLGMIGVMVAVGLELNLFNIVVLPTIIGVGIDNAVHIRHAHLREGRGSIPRVIASCGKATLLSSATTAIGFGAAAMAHHVGIASLGWLALIGVTSAFVVSTVALPALLSVVDDLAARHDAEQPSGAQPAAEQDLALAATQPPTVAESATWRV